LKKLSSFVVKCDYTHQPHGGLVQHTHVEVVEWLQKTKNIWKTVSVPIGLTSTNTSLLRLQSSDMGSGVRGQAWLERRC